MSTLKPVKVTIPNQLEYINIVQATARQIAQTIGFKKEAILEIELALEEGLANIIEHAFEKNEQNTIDVIFEETSLGLKLILKEQGIPFDPNQAPVYHIPAENSDDLSQVSTTGLGSFLMKNLVNEVTFHNLGPEGKETHLIKYLPGKKIEETVDASQLKPFEPEPQTGVVEKIEYEVRRMQMNEAIEVSKGAYKSHGYSFFDDYIYYPDKIMELNQLEQLISIVAVSVAHDFMGHVALYYPYLGAEIAELTFAFVNPEYRSQGCLKRMTECLFSTPKKYPLKGAYAYSVTNHLFTQKALIKYDFQDCGIELATSPATWIFKGIDGDTSQRITVALSFKYLETPPVLTLYAPAHHRAMIEKLYRNIHANHVFEVPSFQEPVFSEENSTLETVIHGAEGSAEIFIKKYGANIVTEVKGLLRDLCVKQMYSITIFLNLEDPQTYYLASKIEELGFFFSGILPYCGIGEGLILQYLNNVAFDYDKVCLLTDIAKETLRYIQGCEPK